MTTDHQPYPYLKPLRVYGFASPPTLTLSPPGTLPYGNALRRTRSRASPVYGGSHTLTGSRSAST
ncbi:MULTISPECIES: hypothetical protein [Fischerella]|uniref:hypothetical protein n=1 Tax=Fischerella TaxID=1190 RepID=UPI00138ABE0B|nr:MULTISPECIES: hypothetical protein [Fischerella]